MLKYSLQVKDAIMADVVNYSEEIAREREENTATTSPMTKRVIPHNKVFTESSIYISLFPLTAYLASKYHSNLHSTVIFAPPPSKSAALLPFCVIPNSECFALLVSASSLCEGGV